MTRQWCAAADALGLAQMTPDPMRDAVIEALNPLWHTGRPETRAEVRKLGEAAGVPKCRCSGVYNCDPWDYPAREALAAHPDEQHVRIPRDAAEVCLVVLAHVEKEYGWAMYAETVSALRAALAAQEPGQ